MRRRFTDALALSAPASLALAAIGVWTWRRGVKERRRAGERLRATERRLRGTFDNAAVGIAHVGLDGRWLRVNDALCRILGYSHGELLRTSFQALTHPDDLGPDLDRVRLLLAGEIETFAMEKRYRRKDGRDVWAELTVSLQRDDAGRPLHFVSIVQDISARKAAETALRDSEQRFREMIDALPVMIVSSNPDGTLAYVNRAWREYTGLSLQDVARDGAVGTVHPDDVAELQATWRRAVAGATPYEAEFRQRGAGGTYRWMHVRAEPVRDESGHVVRWFSAVTDVEERRRLLAAVAAERARLHALIMQTPVAVAFYEGPELRLSLVNHAAEELFGGREVVGRTLFEIFPELRGDPFVEPLYDTYRSGEPHTDVERAVRLAGAGSALRDRYLTTTYQPNRDDEGRIVGVVAVSIDVTEQVRARRALEDTVRFGEQFVGVLGHDLRNPLNAVMMAAKLLQRRGDGPIVQRILSSSERMARMVDQILDLTRSRLGGGIPIHARPVDVARLACGIVDELRTAHPDREIRCEPPNGVCAPADPDRLAQVVSNLVGNALQHGAPARPITVRLDRGGERVRLAVHNEGRPIPPEVLPTIFDPYRRARADGGAGLGLGLYIAQQIVQAHGGHIEIESTAGSGTTFRVVLPCHAAARAPLHAP